MATIIQKKRFANEVKLLKTDPLHYVTAYPDDNDPLVWYFMILGQEETPYHEGHYIGKIVHSKKYPAEPPDYYMLTPSGRYEINKKICLSNSSYHKGEWSSTWNIKTILIAFYSIFLDDVEHGISHIHRPKEERIQLSKSSREYNLKNNNEIYTKFDHSLLGYSCKKSETKVDEANVKINITDINSNIEKINFSIDVQNEQTEELEKVISKI